MQQPNLHSTPISGCMYVAENVPLIFAQDVELYSACVRLLICNSIRSHCELWERLWFEGRGGGGGGGETTPSSEMDRQQQPL